MRKIHFPLILSFLFLGLTANAQFNDPYKSLLKKLMEAEQLADYLQDSGINPNEIHVLDNGVLPSSFRFDEDGKKAVVSGVGELETKGVEIYMVLKKLKVKGRSIKFKYQYGKLKASGLYKLVDGEMKKISSIYSIVEL